MLDSKHPQNTNVQTSCKLSHFALPDGRNPADSRMDCRYRFCIAMENSAAEDYVTEKIYEAFAAGCIPVYYGAPNIAQFIPTKDAIIDYRDFMDPVKLAKEIRRLSGDESAYNLKLAWRIHPESWSEDFNTLVKQADSSVHPQCRVCQVSLITANCSMLKAYSQLFNSSSGTTFFVL